MTQIRDARTKIVQVIDLLKTSGDLLIDAEIVETPPLQPSHPARIFVDLSGPDAAIFVRNNGELLKALHLVVASALDLHGKDHELLWFDVNHLRATHQDHMQRLADGAVARVKTTQRPQAFAPMPSCERHMLHQALESSGLRFASQGEGTERCVVLYPEKITHQEDTTPRPHVSSHHRGAA